MKHFHLTTSLNGYTLYIGLNASKGKAFIIKSGKGVIHSGREKYIRAKFKQLTAKRKKGA